MGMMLETTSRRLFETKGEAHYGSPDKDPAVRLRVLEDAGRLSIPFTTGLLVGIGETLTERAETIFALRAASPRQYGHVQEVIVQNFRAKPDTAMRHADDLGLEEYRRRHRRHPARARPEGAGPGAAQPGRPRRSAGRCSSAGVDDWGGVSPADARPRQPRAPWPSLERLREITAACGFELRARLTVHPEYVVRRRARGSTPASPATSPPSPTTTAWSRPGVRPTGLPWQEPDGGFARSAAPTCTQRSTPRAAPTTAAPTSTTSTATGTRVKEAASAHRGLDERPHRPRGRGAEGRRARPGNLSDEHALTLMTAEGDLLSR